MNHATRLALLCLASSSTLALAQNTPIPACGPANFDASKNVFTVVNPTSDTVNQQCLLTIYPATGLPGQAAQNPAFYPVQGRYAIDLSGGGGGGGGGASNDQGGGGGGAGAAPSRTIQQLSPGVYKLTLGTGGEGGRANGGLTEAGNPSSLTRVDTGQLIAGFAGADVWQQRSKASGGGAGGVGTVGGSSGGNGGGSGDNRVAGVENPAQSGATLPTSGYTAGAGVSGSESRNRLPSSAGAMEANAGGGGGGGVGTGGSGESVARNQVAGAGQLGGGGGGGRGGRTTADSGGQGGHGFIRLTLLAPGTP